MRVSICAVVIVLIGLTPTRVHSERLIIEVTPEMVSPCDGDVPEGACYVLEIPIPERFQNVRVDRASLSFPIIAEEGSDNGTGFLIIRIGGPEELLGGESAERGRSVKSVVVTAGASPSISVDVLGYVRSCLKTTPPVLRLAIGLPDKGGRVPLRYDGEAGVAELRLDCRPRYDTYLTE